MKKRIDRSASGLEYSTSARSSARYFPSRHVSTPSTAQHSLPSTMNGSYPTTCSHHFFPCRSTSHATYLNSSVVLQQHSNLRALATSVLLEDFFITRPHHSSLSANRHEFIFHTVSTCPTSQILYPSHAISPCHLKFRPDRLTDAHTQSLNSPRRAGCENRFRGQSLDAMEGAA